MSSTTPVARPPKPIRLGLRENLAQFLLLVGVNALVGGMIGQERTVLPLLAEEEFGLTAFSSHAHVHRRVRHREGRHELLRRHPVGPLRPQTGARSPAGSSRIPVPLLLMWAPTWGWVIFANVLLGVNQGLTWSTTVIMKIDLVGPAKRGLAMGFNEAAGYGAVAAHRAGHRVHRRASTGCAPNRSTSASPSRRSASGSRHCSSARPTATPSTKPPPTPPRADHLHGELTTGEIFTLTSFKEKALSSASQAGLVNNLNDGLAWGLLPLYFAAAGLSVARIGILAALYPAVWGLGQLVTGGLSDRIGRKPLIAGGMLIQAVALGLFAATEGFAIWAVASVLIGVGTAMVYPTLLATIGDVAHPSWRARSVGIYRLWRDGGFAVGALLAGVLADAFDIPVAIWAVAALTAASGIVVIVRMYETHPRHDRTLVPDDVDLES